jgi:hypothetical protein
MTKEIFQGDSVITTSTGSQYIITAKIRLDSASLNLANLNAMYLKPVGYLESELDSFISVDSTSPTDEWIDLETIFTALDTTTEICLYMDFVSIGDSIEGNLDNLTVQGPIINLSELKTIDINQACSNQEILLSWINYNGEVETWNFTARKAYGIEFGQVQQYRKDITADWPNNFVDGDSEDDYTSIEAFDTLSVVSQFLTLQQINAIKWIKVSKDVYRLDGAKPKRVLVDKNSFTIREDNDKLFQIEFTIRSTERLPVQTA